ncbi:SIR2 family NAD-dependent protein deacylase [Allohahella sp. A8]|uniref:SIR2 family NAD-dependent protein deacylase n=1 Tax=Allohahella sp. A8 TaxID=3141461 RepID=UPI003A80E214
MMDAGNHSDDAQSRHSALEGAADMLLGSRLFVLTGAGISAESGIPTFRDVQAGLWAKFKPEELATPEAFERNPGLVWQWYQQRRRDLRKVAPNAGHLALVELACRLGNFAIVTQNVDDLHERAGSTDVIHLHGKLDASHCFECEAPYISAPEPAADVPRHEQPAKDELPPCCQHCGAYVRPSVVWFGELLPAKAWEAAETAARQCDVLLCVGTSSLVYPAAHLPGIVLDAGGRVIQVNPEVTALDDRATISLRGKAGTVLPALLEAVARRHT